MQIRTLYDSVGHHPDEGDDIIRGNDLAWQPNASHQETTMGQHSESEESISDSEESMSDPDSDLLNLDPEPLAELFGDDLFAQRMCEWLTTTKYDVPEQDRLALPYPRTVDPDVDKPKDYHLVCPFYLEDPEGYRSCLGDPLRTINELKLHIVRTHSTPPYCPICRKPFDTACLRDDHTKARDCEPGKHDVPWGYDGSQRRKLWKSDDTTIPDAQRWMNIYWIGFDRLNGEFPSEVAYLTDDLGLMITKIYDYINVFLDEIRARYLCFIWYKLKETGWLNAFIRHYLDHVQSPLLAENEAMRISHCLSIWLRYIFPIDGANGQLEFSNLYSRVMGSTCNFCVTFSNISSDLPTADNFCESAKGEGCNR